MKNRNRALEVLFEDDALVAISKPAGVASTHDGARPGEPEVCALLEPHFGDLWPVHRLDRDTSGAMVLARTEASHRALNAQFQDRDVAKTYHAILVGSPGWEERTADAPLLADGDRRHRTIVDVGRGKPAVTGFRVLRRFKRHALVEAQPRTGRTHQIRAHAALLGNPVAMDALYGDGKPILLSELKRNYRIHEEREEIPLIGRLALHALRLQFTHPVTGEPVEIEAPYPKDFNAAVNQLSKL
jgi:RluA family pseudouridine synthase